MLKRYAILCILVATGMFIGGCGRQDTIYQVSTLQALMDGVYDGNVTIGQLKNEGDFGIGTVNALDGELVLLGGKAWHICGDGIARELPNSAMTPFAAVTQFDPDMTFALPDKMAAPRFKACYDTMISTNLPYAIMIEGEFDYVKTRSVPKQKKPYPPLAQVAKTQPTFEFKKVRGTMIGYRLPEYLKGVNVAGYHLHFITADRKAGGHVLDFTIRNVIVKSDTCYNLDLHLPKQKEFSQANLVTTTEEVNAVEK